MLASISWHTHIAFWEYLRLVGDSASALLSIDLVVGKGTYGLGFRV